MGGSIPILSETFSALIAPRMEIIDHLRQVANIVDIASQYTTLRKRGRKHVGLCPFHSEKDPSFTVDGEKQLFHCFGCGVGGDVFTLIMEKENLSFPEALNYLAERYHIPLPQKTRLAPEVVKLEEKIFKINEMALAFFRRCLYQTKEGETALDYLKKRGLGREILEMLRVGYAPNSWNALINYFQEKNLESTLLEKAGLAVPSQKKSDFYDRFRGRVIFPIFSLTGKVVAFGGRTVTSAEPKYLNSPDTPIYSKGKVLYGLNWTKGAVAETKEMILVEGYTDFAMLYQAGIRNIAASLGTALTSDQVYLGHRFASTIIFNYDGDQAGKIATSRGIPLSFELGKQPRVLLLPENLDPDNFIRKYGAEKYLQLKESKSIPLIKFLIDMQIPPGNYRSIEDKLSIARRIIEIILINPDTISGSEYLRQLCDDLDLNEQIVRSSIKKGPAKKADGQAEILLLHSEKRLLQILLDNRPLAPRLLAEMRPEDFRGLKSESAFRFLLDWRRAGREVSFSELTKAVGPGLSRYLSQIRLEEAPPGTDDEAMDCLSSLRKMSLEARLRALQKEIVRCERSGEKNRLPRLLTQKQDLMREILTL
jgi:DNA primase